MFFSYISTSCPLYSNVNGISLNSYHGNDTSLCPIQGEMTAKRARVGRVMGNGMTFFDEGKEQKKKNEMSILRSPKNLSL